MTSLNGKKQFIDQMYFFSLRLSLMSNFNYWSTCFPFPNSLSKLQLLYIISIIKKSQLIFFPSSILFTCVEWVEGC